jgi:iron complex transport system substrate-binding protein
MADLASLLLAVSVVRHAMGETAVAAPPRRVVVLTNEGTEAVLALGLTPVGAVRSWTARPFYAHIAKAMRGVALVGDEDHVDVPSIAALHPDLILGNKLRQRALYAPLSAIAPTVFSETLRGEWQRNFRLYAEALGRPRRGEEVLAAWRRRVAAIRRRLGDRRTLGVAVLRFMADRTRIYHEESFSGSILREVGFTRASFPASSASFEEVTLDRLPELDGDVLFYFTYEEGDGRATRREKEWTSDPRWRGLRAVREGRAFEVDDGIWNTAGGILAAERVLDDLVRFFSRIPPPGRSRGRPGPRAAARP